MEYVINKKTKPIFFVKKEECCGCAACYAICPNNAITMESDFEGFLYPILNCEKCILCHKCLNVCPIKLK